MKNTETALPFFNLQEKLSAYVVNFSQRHAKFSTEFRGGKRSMPSSYYNDYATVRCSQCFFVIKNSVKLPALSPSVVNFSQRHAKFSAEFRGGKRSMPFSYYNDRATARCSQFIKNSVKLPALSASVVNKIALFLIILSLSFSCSTEPAKEPVQQIKVVQPDEKLTLIFTGDLLLDRGVREVIERKSVDYLFSEIKDELKSADFVVANLECPVTAIKNAATKRFVFRADTQWISSLHNNGITHACMANNHSMDQGRDGIRDTYKNLRKHGIQPLGFGNTQKDALKPVLIHSKNKTIAMFSSVLLRLENWSYFSDSAGVCQATAEELTEKISAYKKQFPQHLVIAVLHWGVEYQPHPDAIQRKNAHAFIEAGANAVIGHHPHMVQDHEVYKGKHIFYSLGNFIFDAIRKEGNKGQLVKLEITNDSVRAIEIPISIEGCRPVAD